MPRTWLQIGRKEDIPIIIQACEKIKQMIGGFHRNSGFLLFFAICTKSHGSFYSSCMKKKKITEKLQISLLFLKPKKPPGKEKLSTVFP